MDLDFNEYNKVLNNAMRYYLNHCDIEIRKAIQSENLELAKSWVQYRQKVYHIIKMQGEVGK